MKREQVHVTETQMVWHRFYDHNIHTGVYAGIPNFKHFKE
jgi:hypothetical protein